MLKRALNRLHRWAGRSSLVTNVAVKLRNQCECIVGYALGEDAEVTDAGNSERWLISLVAGEICTFFDIGANRGDWTRSLIHFNPEACGCICEPVDSLFQLLVNEFGGNRRLELRQVALSDAVGRARLGIMAGDAKTSSLCESEHLKAARVVELPTTTVDELVTELGWEKIDFLKIDCEGFDLRVLRGSHSVLSTSRVGLIQFEYNSVWPQAGSTLADALRLLESHGYAVRLLRKRQLSVFDYRKWGEFRRYANFVAFKPESRLAARLMHGHA